MTNEEIIKQYPIQDDQWPSRRWNKECTDYCDLSGVEDKMYTREELVEACISYVSWVNGRPPRNDEPRTKAQWFDKNYPI